MVDCLPCPRTLGARVDPLRLKRLAWRILVAILSVASTACVCDQWQSDDTILSGASELFGRVEVIVRHDSLETRPEISDNPTKSLSRSIDVGALVQERTRIHVPDGRTKQRRISVIQG